MAKKLFKRGMSPIIATMLLIALAVSIGATIMSFGGLYYEKIRLKDATCSKILINAFELEGKRQCRDYEFKSIVNFYHVNEDVKAPQCYIGIAAGKGNICTKSDKLLNFTWAPIKNVIK